jgi:F420-non-reducing hydrogenase iron-sulfur subunit
MQALEPKIIVFACNWCTSKEVEELDVPSNVRIVKVKCSGRIDPTIILELFRRGSDGIIVFGCPLGECHYEAGNFHAEKKIKMLKKLMSLAGLNSERLRLEWISPLEEAKFTEIIKNFVGRMKALGCSPLAGEKSDVNMLINLEAAKSAAEDFRLRVLVGREKWLLDDGNVYGEPVNEREFNVLLDEVVKAEFIRQKIHILTRQKPLSVKELAAIIQMKPALVLRHIANMRRKGMIALDHVERTTPLYKALEV